jgi:hypothetical protein
LVHQQDTETVEALGDRKVIEIRQRSAHIEGFAVQSLGFLTPAS